MVFFLNGVLKRYLLTSLWIIFTIYFHHTFTKHCIDSKAFDVAWHVEWMTLIFCRNARLAAFQFRGSWHPAYRTSPAFIFKGAGILDSPRGKVACRHVSSRVLADIARIWHALRNERRLHRLLHLQQSWNCKCLTAKLLRVMFSHKGLLYSGFHFGVVKNFKFVSIII